MARAGIGDRVEGFHAVAAAVKAGRASSVMIEQRRLKGGAYTGLSDAARSSGAKVEYVTTDITQPQDVEALIDRVLSSRRCRGRAMFTSKFIIFSVVLFFLYDRTGAR